MDRASSINFMASIPMTTDIGKTKSTAIWPDVVTVLLLNSVDSSVWLASVFRLDTVVVTVVVVGVVVGAWRYQGKINLNTDFNYGNY